MMQMVFRDGKWIIQYFGEENELIGADTDFIYLQGLETGLPAMIRKEIFEKEILKKA
jgi:hypothetical protein